MEHTNQSIRTQLIINRLVSTIHMLGHETTDDIMNIFYSSFDITYSIKLFKTDKSRLVK